jgi:hypothetical protein
VIANPLPICLRRWWLLINLNKRDGAEESIIGASIGTFIVLIGFEHKVLDSRDKVGSVGSMVKMPSHSSVQNMFLHAAFCVAINGNSVAFYATCSMFTVEFILMVLFQLLWRCNLGPPWWNEPRRPS